VWLHIDKYRVWASSQGFAFSRKEEDEKKKVEPQIAK
jgi:hypothetical protein